MTPDAPALTRTQRRLLCRIYNGRTAPITVDGHSFLTFREASKYLLMLDHAERERAYLAMKLAAAVAPDAGA